MPRSAKSTFPVLAEQKLYRACKIIFGPEVVVSPGFLQYMQKSGLKSSYRQRALETHPDCCPNQSEFGKRRMSMMFHSVCRAYEDLKDFLEAREKGLYPQLTAHLQNYDKGASWPQQPHDRKHDKPSGHRGAGRQPQQMRPPRRRVVKPRSAMVNNSRPGTEKKIYHGSLPKRKLLFGHYLYYSGLIDWQTLIQALVWQRNQQPRLGEIGRRLGWLSKKDILAIMRHRSRTRPFGRSAVQMGLLSESQLKILLGQQKKYRKKIGGYFVEKNIFTQHRLLRLVEQCRRHNSRRQSSHLYQV